MSDNDDRLISLMVGREALRSSQGTNSLGSILAGISAEITRRAADQKRQDSANANVGVPLPKVKPAFVEATRDDNSWPLEKDFPLTPVEAWHLLQGFAVKPGHAVSDELLKFFGDKVVYVDNYLRLK